MRKVRILYLLPDMSNAGPINMCLSLIKDIDKENIDMTVLALGDGEKENEFLKYTKVKKIKRRNFWEVISFIRNNNFDIVHSHCIISDIFLFLSFLSKKIKITTIHNYPDKDSIYRRGKVIGGALAKLQLFSIKKMHKVACSNSVKKYCENSLGLTNVIAIPNGVSKGIYKKNILIGNENKLSVDFFYLGSLNERKNVEVILKAFKMWRKNKRANLHVIGDGEIYQKLVDEYRSESIFFHGKISNPYELIIQYDCFVSSSKAEGMPLSLLESMSMRKAYICSDIDPHVEVYNSSACRAGFIFKLSEGTDGLISAFEQFYNQEKKCDLYKCSLETFKGNYTSEIMSNKYRDLYLYLYENFTHE